MYPKMQIKTDRECAAFVLPEGKNQATVSVYSNGNAGLFLLVRSDAKAKSWIYRYYIAKKLKKLNIGTYPSMSLAEARVAHAKAVADVKKGIDPRFTILAEKKHNEQMPLLNELFEEWISHKETSKRRDGIRPEISVRTAKDYRNVYNSYISPTFGKTRVSDITMAMLHKHYQKLQSVSLDGLRKAMLIVKQLMSEAIRRQLIELSPVLALEPKIYNATPSLPRERWLSLDELKRLWIALEDGTQGGGAISAGGNGVAKTVVLSGSMMNVLKFIILTAVRRGEAVSMRWIDIENDKWTIPETKSGRPHLVTLSPLALNIINEQRSITSQLSPFVFESPSKPGRHIHHDAVTTALTRIRLKFMPDVEPFTVHDLRRTVATLVGIELDAGPLEIEHMLNHQISGKLLRTYQAGALRNPEKLRKLFLKWGKFVEENIVNKEEMTMETSNVIHVPFRKKDI